MSDAAQNLEMPQNLDIPQSNAAAAETPAAHTNLAVLAAELADTKDKLLRALAEADNIRRRSEKERADTAKYAAGNLAKELLPVADTLQRAADVARKQVSTEAAPALRSVLEGILATERLLQQAFASAGIKQINPEGQAFDPNFHRVMAEIEAPDHAAGTVVQVLQPGYMINDRLLREAMVAVAKGGSAAAHQVDEQV